MAFTKGGKYGRQPLNLTEGEVRYAIANSRSNREAAAYANVSHVTWKKYASMYVDAETGKTLYEKHKNQKGYGVSKGGIKKFGKYGLQDILEGRHPEYNPKNLKKRIIRACIVKEECALCGFHERRVADYSIPLILEFIDSDITNHKLENIRLLCYNCYYLNVGNIAGIQKNLSRLINY